MPKNRVAIAILIAVAAVGLLVVAQAYAQAPLQITGVEPRTMPAQTGGTLSIYGSGFTPSTTVRLVSYGLLDVQFVNETALRAVVPANVQPGIYDVQLNDTISTTTMTGALQILAPPPTPAPPSSAPSGKPNLTIRNYSIQPSQVRAGTEFVATIEIYNNGSRASENTLVVFPGGTFQPVGTAGYQLWQVHINATVVITQRLRAPATLASGVQNLGIDLSGNDYEGNHYEFPQTIGIEVIGTSSGGTASGAPKLVIESAETVPAIVGPGNPFTLTLRLTNHGNRTATNVVVGIGGTSATPAEGSNVVSAATVRMEEAVTVTLPLVLGDVEKGGRQGLQIALQYSDYSGGSYTDQQTVGLEVNTSLANRPQLLIESYTITPQRLSPGDRFTLTLTIANVGGGDAQQLLVSLGGEGGEKLDSFVPADSSNVSFADLLPVGESIEVTQRLIVDGAAQPKAYNVPVWLAYDDMRGNHKSETQRISLMVLRRPEFMVDFYRPVEGMAMVGIPFPLPVEIINTSQSRINVPLLEVTSEQLMIENGSTFIGSLEPTASGTLDAMAIASQSGPAEVIVAIHYLDDFSQEQVISKTLTVEVMEAPPEVPGMEGGPQDVPDQPETIWQTILRVLRGLFGLGS